MSAGSGGTGKQMMIGGPDDDPADRSMQNRPASLYLVLAAGLAYAALRILVWLLCREGVISPADVDSVVLLALPFALLSILIIAPRSPRD